MRGMPELTISSTSIRMRSQVKWLTMLILLVLADVLEELEVLTEGASYGLPSESHTKSSSATHPKDDFRNIQYYGRLRI